MSHCPCHFILDPYWAHYVKEENYFYVKKSHLSLHQISLPSSQVGLIVVIRPHRMTIKAMLFNLICTSIKQISICSCKSKKEVWNTKKGRWNPSEEEGDTCQAKGSRNSLFFCHMCEFLGHCKRVVLVLKLAGVLGGDPIERLLDQVATILQ